MDDDEELSLDDFEQVSGGRKNPGKSRTTIDYNEEFTLDDLNDISWGESELRQSDDPDRFPKTYRRKKPGKKADMNLVSRSGVVLLRDICIPIYFPLS